jgi:hypothetical protein
LLSVLALLSAAPAASAYYDPGVQRWINRDPAGKEEGVNLYAFAENNPLSHHDPLGLAVAGAPCSDPCSEAQRLGLDNGDVAGVVCYGGRKYICVWISGGATGARDNAARGIIDKCSRVHESKHLDDIDCPPGPCVTRPPFKPGKDPTRQECAAYRAELACLRGSLGDCKGNPQCISQVVAEIQSDKREMRRMGCAPPP